MKSEWILRENEEKSKVNNDKLLKEKRRLILKT